MFFKSTTIEGPDMYVHQNVSNQLLLKPMLSGKINTRRIDIGNCINLNSEIFYFYLLKFSCKTVESESNITPC